MSEDWHYRTFAQYAYCVSVSFSLFWDTGAVGVLRHGLWWSALTTFVGIIKKRGTIKFPARKINAAAC